jgi:ABC-2 type transport system ATP-binding protein
MIGEKDIVRLTGKFDVAAVRRALEHADGVEIVSVDERMLRLAVEGASRRLPMILSAVTGAGGELLETSLSQPSLESLFIKLTGRELRE